MPIASRRTLPPRVVPRSLTSLELFAWFGVLPTVVGTAAWVYGFTIVSVVCALCVLFLLVGVLLSRIRDPRAERLAAERFGESTCSFARSFDFRRVDTRVIRAVYDELQDYVAFPIRASDHLVNDLHIDEEDFALDIVPAITRRTGRSLVGYETNPHYQQSDTVRGLVHLFASQPVEPVQKT